MIRAGKQTHISNLILPSGIEPILPDGRSYGMVDEGPEAAATRWGWTDHRFEKPRLEGRANQCALVGHEGVGNYRCGVQGSSAPQVLGSRLRRGCTSVQKGFGESRRTERGLSSSSSGAERLGFLVTGVLRRWQQAVETAAVELLSNLFTALVRT